MLSTPSTEAMSLPPCSGGFHPWGRCLKRYFEISRGVSNIPVRESFVVYDDERKQFNKREVQRLMSPLSIPVDAFVFV